MGERIQEAVVLECDVRGWLLSKGLQTQAPRVVTYLLRVNTEMNVEEHDNARISGNGSRAPLKTCISAPSTSILIASIGRSNRASANRSSRVGSELQLSPFPCGPPASRVWNPLFSLK
jgi:hypothetical protein